VAARRLSRSLGVTSNACRRPNWHPGGGKTTFLNGVREHGYQTVDESARAIIAERRSQGLSPRPEPLEFAREVLRRDIEKHIRHANEMRLIFFDRGVVDAVGMLDDVVPIESSELQALLVTYPYDRQVLVFPPWESMYRIDNERDQTFDAAQQIHARVTAWYRRCGYELFEVPTSTVAERLEYVLRSLNCGNA
jgi:predicted ATPase